MDNKVAIITGSTKGIGRGAAEVLAKRGVKVIITSRNLADAKTAANEINQAGGEAAGLQFNIEEPESFSSFISMATEIYGRLDILINNALSQSTILPLEDASKSQLDFAITSNLTNTLYLTKLAYPHLKESRGNIINISSVVINRHLFGLTIYSIIKAGIVQMTKALAADWADDKIRVNAISPGFIYTAALKDKGVPEELISQTYNFWRDSYHPLKEIGNPEDIGKLLAYLSSDDARLVTGSVFDIDGGYTVQGRPLFQETDTLHNLS